jgi:3-hydroxyisobutyrate dehydrogenase
VLKFLHIFRVDKIIAVSSTAFLTFVNTRKANNIKAMNDTVLINQIPYNLDDTLQDCWHRLINGAVSARHPFHCPSIATIKDDFPEIRTVVLRKVLQEERTLIFHTDSRSPKINQIKGNNRISWLFYDPKARIQLRIKTVSTIHQGDEFSAKRWNDSTVESRRCYLVQPAPSTIAKFPTDGLPENLDLSNLPEEIMTAASENFSVVKNIVMEIDWLFLNHDGHRRAKFIFGEHEVQKFWMIP